MSKLNDRTEVVSSDSKAINIKKANDLNGREIGVILDIVDNDDDLT